MTRLGYQIPNFTLPPSAGPSIVGNVIEQAKAAEAAGVDRVVVMDHFYQLPGIGAPDEPMIEAYTLLAAIAQHTQTVRLSTLVTGNTYRNPSLLAKTITALDHVSNGRATLGIGAGWFELEHQSLGFPFDTFTERFEKLEEALQIVIPMLRGERVTFEGSHYQVHDAVNSPAPLSRIPIMIGGNGEKKTLRMVAQYADESNLASGSPPTSRASSALAAHCERLGRDRSEIKVTKLTMVCIAPTMEQAEADLAELAAVKGFSSEVVEMVKQIVIFGDPDTVGEELAAVMATGIDGMTINLPINGHHTDRIGLLGEVARRAMGDA
ncbi:MAG: LLM class F420-dependent oxidoreductase [Ilumatobacteraceae bacterium]